MLAEIPPDRRSKYTLEGYGDEVSVWWEPPSSSTRRDLNHVPRSTFSSRSSTPHSQHSHDFEPCFGGQAHGQGGPVYSCGCYRRKVQVEATDAPEQHQGLGIQQKVDNSKENMLPVKRKRSESSLESDPLVTTPCFGRNLINVQRAKSAPALEVPKPRKLAKIFELNGSLATHDTLIMNVVKHLEAAVDRQTEVLSKIYGVLESSAK
ncbi:hypothetical protein EV424DRAFT_1539550 [Suillus variegatus]|nr:hypothetical protein EV424DRAFT_1539550 [Suillus variegatus]